MPTHFGPFAPQGKRPKCVGILNRFDALRSLERFHNPGKKLHEHKFVTIRFLMPIIYFKEKKRKQTDAHLKSYPQK